MRRTSILICLTTAVFLASASGATAQDASGQASPRQSQVELFLVNTLTPPKGQMPDLAGAHPWFNTKPLTAKDLRGHVVVLAFWGYDCPGCLAMIAPLKALNAKYRDSGLIVVGVHPALTAFWRQPATPSKSKEDLTTIERIVKDSGITYPVVFDENGDIYRAIPHNTLPAHYFVDRQGNFRSVSYAKPLAEQLEELLAEGRQPSEGVQRAATVKH